MNFEQIKSFLSVAKTGNFSQAAKERFISQPTISNQMRMLEEELDTKLFLRTSKNTTLTEQGQKFYKYATQLLAIEKDIYISIKEKKRGVYGILDVAAPHLQTDCQLGTFVNRMIEDENTPGGVSRSASWSMKMSSYRSWCSPVRLSWEYVIPCFTIRSWNIRKHLWKRSI